MVNLSQRGNSKVSTELKGQWARSKAAKKHAKKHGLRTRFWSGALLTPLAGRRDIATETYHTQSHTEAGNRASFLRGVPVLRNIPYSLAKYHYNSAIRMGKGFETNPNVVEANLGKLDYDRSTIIRQNGTVAVKLDDLIRKQHQSGVQSDSPQLAKVYFLRGLTAESRRMNKKWPFVIGDQRKKNIAEDDNIAILAYTNAAKAGDFVVTALLHLGYQHSLQVEKYNADTFKGDKNVNGAYTENVRAISAFERALENLAGTKDYGSAKKAASQLIALYGIERELRGRKVDDDAVTYQEDLSYNVDQSMQDIFVQQQEVKVEDNARSDSTESNIEDKVTIPYEFAQKAALSIPKSGETAPDEPGEITAGSFKEKYDDAARNVKEKKYKKAAQGFSDAAKAVQNPQDLEDPQRHKLTLAHINAAKNYDAIGEKINAAYQAVLAARTFETEKTMNLRSKMLQKLL